MESRRNPFAELFSPKLSLAHSMSCLTQFEFLLGIRTKSALLTGLLLMRELQWNKNKDQLIFEQGVTGRFTVRVVCFFEAKITE